MHVEWPLECDQATVDKVRGKHGVSIEEAEEAVFDDAPHYRRGRAQTLLVFGQAISGRYLFMVLAKALGRGRYRLLTAREMGEAERAYYRRQRRG